MQQQTSPELVRSLAGAVADLDLGAQAAPQDGTAGSVPAAAEATRERGPPSLRPKRSQRFTVAASAANLVPPMPSAPGSSRPSSIASSVTSDDDDHHAPTRPKLYSTSSSSTLNPLAAPVQPFQFQSYHSSPSSAAASLTPAPLPQRAAGRAGQWTDQQNLGYGAPTAHAQTVDDDDVIPTAIVIKNIPFSIKREQLLAVIEDLMIPLPYAFNYHFDQGIFRGLAFANFRLPVEADSAVVALNGYDLSGRKLRVEYKKVLQAGEKERIEKEKAIKRMRSMQLQKEQEALRDHQQYYGNVPMPPQLPPSFGSDEYGDPVSRGATPYLGPVLSPGPSSRSLREYPFDGVSAGPDRPPTSAVRSVSRPASGHVELDMNDAQTLEMYSRVLLFKDDAMRDSLEFSKSLTATQRRLVHQVAKKLGLEHRSEGAGEERRVVVYKAAVSSGATTPGKGRQGRSIGTGSSYLSPSDPASGMRKKSMPDLRGGQPPSSQPQSGQESPSRSTGMMRRSQVNLREGFSSSVRKPNLPATTDAAPPVPSFSNGFEAHFGGAGGNAIRQPRGPPDAGKGFGDKMRMLRSGANPVAPASPAPSSGSVLSAASGVSSANSAPVVLANSFAGGPSVSTATL